MALLLNAGDTVSRSYSYTHPSPLHPSQPQGTGERTKNLFDQSDFSLLTVTPTAYRYGTSVGILPQGTYTFNATKTSGAQSIYLTAKLNDVYSHTTISSVPFSFTADGDSEYIIRTANNTGTTWEAEKYLNMMLNTGSTPLPYEPYGYKIPILSANTTTPVYLGEVETTRNIKKLVLTGDEIIAGDIVYSRFFFTIQDMRGEGVRLTKLLCTHYQNISDGRPIGNVPDNSIYAGGGVDIQKVFIKTTDYTTVTDFKAYLAAQYAAGTPVTIWYILTEPETAIVNEPLMKIGDYADTVSNVLIPVTSGGDTLSVGATVQPSEVTVNYKGWHPVADVHERNNGAWT